MTTSPAAFTLSAVAPAIVDTDSDGIADSSDNCLSVANATQTDTDGDGVGDACDATPNGDDDEDGVDNLEDNCPSVANEDQADVDNNDEGDACDTVDPVVSVPADITEEATGASGAAVTYVVPVSASDNVEGSVAVTCEDQDGNAVDLEGQTFPLGTTTVTCFATDTVGNTGSDSFSVTVVDTTAPQLSVPADITEEATGASGAAVTFLVSATDAVDADVDIECFVGENAVDLEGQTFPLGTTTVDCIATDDAGLTDTGSFTVTVEDTTKPTFNSDVPVDFEVEATGANGATVTYTDPTATDTVDANVDVDCVPASGTVFSLGSTEVTCTATDDAGNEATTTFSVIVQDTTAPVIASHGNETAEATGPNGALVTYTAPTATDTVDGPFAASCLPASGAQFALGTTTVTCSATDAAGNPATATTFTVTVTDTRAPAVTVPANQTVEATGPGGAAVTYTASAEDIVSGEVDVLCTPASDSTFPLGSTTVACSA
ncbi:MAG: HYR domain-containing protein, partial [Chloroflexota bacterium]|nr:HYR domain-containing protein [Chloroflexota bacterium]